MAEELEPAEVTRARQRRRGMATLLVVVLTLFFAFWYAYSYYRDDTERRAAARPKTSCAPVRTVKPREVSVNLYNATQREGIAAAAAKQLRSRGFDVGTVANDPKGAKVAQSAEVRYEPATANEARLVAAQVAGARLVADEGRSDGTIDLVLGDRYTRLAAYTPAPTQTCR